MVTRPAQASVAALEELGTQTERNDSGEIVVVSFYETQITDTGLEHLKGLTELQELWLDGTQVTDAGCR